MVFISQILHGFFYGITIPLLWAMIADVADYSEWKNNRRATAIIFSAMLLRAEVRSERRRRACRELLASTATMRGGPEQAPQVVNGIRLAVSVYAAIPFLICCVLLFLYEIDKAMESRIEQDLGQRRAVAA